MNQDASEFDRPRAQTDPTWLQNVAGHVRLPAVVDKSFNAMGAPQRSRHTHRLHEIHKPDMTWIQWTSGSDRWIAMLRQLHGCE